MKKKSINNIISIILGLILVLSFININIFNHLNDCSDKNNQYSRENLKLSDYSPILSRDSQQKIDIMLQQSLLNKSNTEFDNLSDSYSFSQPSPTDISFNSSFINMTIKDISAPNKTIRLEDSSSSSWNFQYQRLAGGFKIFSKGYLINLSICIYRDGNPGENTSMRVRIFNSTWSGGHNVPTTISLGTLVASDTSIEDIDGWYRLTFDSGDFYLDPSKTTNNTFYIELLDSMDYATEWYYVRDDVDGSNDMNTFYWSAGWVNFTRNGKGTDFCMEVELAPLSNTPQPEDIDLKINNEKITNIANGKGYWNPSTSYGSGSGKINFDFSVGWWDVACNVTEVQINYTKTNLKADTSLRCLGNGLDILWNVSCPNLNYFSSHPDLKWEKINFTIPSKWQTIEVWNGNTNKTDDCTIHSDKNGYKDVTVSNAGNGTYWHLTASSENLLESIHTYIGTNPVDVVNYTDVGHFNASFKEKLAQDNGVINLSVYSPAAINDKLNFTSTNSTFDSGSEFYLGKWDISDTVTGYGEFRVQVFWNNDTAAGFIEKVLTIIGQTDLTLKAPDQEAVFRSDETFNIIVYYEDSNFNTAINGATIDYNIDGQGWQSTTLNNGTIGYYIVPVDCSVFTSEGLKTLEIRANKNYYESQTLFYNFNVIGPPIPITEWWEVLLITLGYSAPLILALTAIVLFIRKRRRG